MMGSAQLEIQPEADAVFALEEPSALKQEVARKLAAHRLRRARTGVAAAVEAEQRGRGDRQRSVAAAVAERYAQTPSYRAFLAQEAERALLEAAAAAEIAQRNAVAVAAVQQELLAELEKYEAPQAFTPATAAVVTTRKASDSPVRQVSTAGLTVKLYEDLGRTVPALRPVPPPRHASHADIASAFEADALEEEIAFRQAPVFEEYRAQEPAVPLPANLLEFPRQLVASVKARPSFALGPLREQAGPRSGQLRIFEVEPEQIAVVPEPPSVVPEWHDIFLDAHTATAPLENEGLPTPGIMPSLLPPLTAPMQLRLMAAAVDALLVLGGFVAFTAVFARITGPVAAGLPLAVAAIAVIALLFLGYQMLFFTLSDQTPGMRYARIGLCTFSDENPTRRAMRKRVLAQVVAAAPMGLGLLWALLDEDKLGWHDRLSQMYQRAY